MKTSTPEVLERLEAFYGKQEPCWPTDPYLFIVWWHCGYPASDAACARGWQSLSGSIGADPPRILAASIAELTKALTPGGMVPALRARRLKEIAARIQDDFGGDLRRGLAGPLPQIRKALKKFPNIADPGADRILLFSGVAPAAAVPSNCPHVLVRILRGVERENYGVNYRQAQEAIASAGRDAKRVRFTRVALTTRAKIAAGRMHNIAISQWLQRAATRRFRRGGCAIKITLKKTGWSTKLAAW